MISISILVNEKANIQTALSEVSRLYREGCDGGTFGRGMGTFRITDESNPKEVWLVYVDWDTSGEDICADDMLPKEVCVPKTVDEEDIADWLSNEYGFCVNGYSILAQGKEIDEDAEEEIGEEIPKRDQHRIISTAFGEVCVKPSNDCSNECEVYIGDNYDDSIEFYFSNINTMLESVADIDVPFGEYLSAGYYSPSEKEFQVGGEDFTNCFIQGSDEPKNDCLAIDSAREKTNTIIGFDHISQSRETLNRETHQAVYKFLCNCKKYEHYFSKHFGDGVFDMQPTDEMGEVVPNGAYITIMRWEPSIGEYQSYQLIAIRWNEDKGLEVLAERIAAPMEYDEVRSSEDWEIFYEDYSPDSILTIAAAICDMLRDED